MGRTRNQVYPDDRIELIVVFKKEISDGEAEVFLKENGNPASRTGMDSSRGKLYYYKTGPKFIVTFDSNEDREAFRSATQDRPEIYEVYTPDWTIQKD